MTETASPRILPGNRPAVAVMLAVIMAAAAACASASSSRDVNPSAAPIQSSESGSSAASSPPSSTTPSQASASGTALPFVVPALGRDTLGLVVATDGLRVRSLPTVGDDSEQREPLLPEGMRFYTVDGPVTADGYGWYQVQPYGGEKMFPFGWIAAGGRDGEPWIEHLRLGCDTVAPSPEGLASGEPLEHLYCSLAGDSPRTSPPGPDIEVEGDVYCTMADDHWGFLSGPEWIDQRGYCELRTNVGSVRLSGQPMMSVLGPGSPVEGRYAIVGHLDDPGARDCSDEGFEGSDQDPAEVVLLCRTFIVVTEATPVQGD